MQANHTALPSKQGAQTPTPAKSPAIIFSLPSRLCLRNLVSKLRNCLWSSMAVIHHAKPKPSRPNRCRPIYDAPGPLSFLAANPFRVAPPHVEVGSPVHRVFVLSLVFQPFSSNGPNGSYSFRGRESRSQHCLAPVTTGPFWLQTICITSSRFEVNPERAGYRPLSATCDVLACCTLQSGRHSLRDPPTNDSI